MAVDTVTGPAPVSKDAGTRARVTKDSGAVQRAAQIINIQPERFDFNLKPEIQKGIRPADGGEKALPTLLLYDEAGLKLFEKITYLEEYYPTNTEIEVLTKYSERIAERIQPGSLIVELGSGNLRKVNILLQTLERLGKDVEYYALDVSYNELERTLADVPLETYKHVKCYGLHGTYDDGLEWMKTDVIRTRPKCIISLGSSIGNFKRKEAGPFLKGFGDILQPGDTMLIGIDGCKDPDKVYHAYNDREGVTHAFIMGGLQNANRILGQNAFKSDEWEVIGEYDKDAGRHHAFVSPRRNVKIDGVLIRQGERVRIEESYKYSPDETRSLFAVAGLTEGARWSNQSHDYALHMAFSAEVAFDHDPQHYGAKPVPSVRDWEKLWILWDSVTRMIPEEELLKKPIKLRNACIFYLGHIPTFLDMQLTKTTGSKPTEPSYYPRIFERGIDPDVENPEQCHAHSEIPDEWPPVEEILNFQRQVRKRVYALYKNDAPHKDRKLGRSIWLGYEHEIMHLETLLYMLVQSEKTLPPPGTVRPDFEALARQAKHDAVPNQWVDVPAQDITIGLQDAEENSGPDRYFGWDNEKPSRKAHVPSFVAQARPITNGEYAKYLVETGGKKIPASWVGGSYDSSNVSHRQANGHSNGVVSNGASGASIAETADSSLHPSMKGISVRTVYGAVPLELALDWPVAASYDELAGCAQWMGGRIPTMEETRSIYTYVARIKEEGLKKSLGKGIPAVNSHLINNGVQESPPPNGPVNGGVVSKLDPHDVFMDLEGANVGFKHWHPFSVTQNGSRLSGQGDMGGVWEWTSTVLEKHEGFEPMKLYPAYTADFFDGKHNVCLGGSWATHPRVAGRKSFVNWYQRNYPYVWAGARIVRDT